MKHLKKLLVAGAVLAAVAMPMQSAQAYWGGPWGGGPWGGPWGGGPWGGGPYAATPYGSPWGGAPVAGQGLASIPGWSPSEVAEKYDFYGPYGPSITDVRRFHRDLWWGRPMDDLVFPMGPSPTDIRRQQRREWYRSMGVPY